MENEFNPDEQDMGEYEVGVEKDVEVAKEETTKQRLARIEETFGKEVVAEALGELSEDYQEKGLENMSESEIQALDEFEFSEKGKPLAIALKKQAATQQTERLKEIEIAKRMATKEFPELLEKFPYVYSHLVRVTQEIPSEPFEKRCRAAMQRTINYLGLNEKVLQRKQSEYANDMRTRQERIKQTLTPEQQWKNRYGKEED